MYSHIRNYFIAHPLDGDGAAKALPEWDFPGAARVERLLSTSERAHALAERIITQAPRSDRTRQFARNLDRTRRRLDFFRRYHSLYNEYAQSELHFVDDHTLALTRALHPDDQASLRLRHRGLRLEDLHRGRALPIGHRPGPQDGRLAAQAGQPAEHDEGPEPGHRGREGGRDLRPRRHDHVDQRDRAVPVGPAAGASTPLPARRGGPGARRLPGYLQAERRDRGTLPAGGLPPVPRASTSPSWSSGWTPRMAPPMLSRLSPEAVRRISEHRAAGHTTILITGVVRPFTRPLRPCST